MAIATNIWAIKSCRSCFCYDFDIWQQYPIHNHSSLVQIRFFFLNLKMFSFVPSNYYMKRALIFCFHLKKPTLGEIVQRVVYYRLSLKTSVNIVAWISRSNASTARRIIKYVTKHPLWSFKSNGKYSEARTYETKPFFCRIVTDYEKGFVSRIPSDKNQIWISPNRSNRFEKKKSVFSGTSERSSYELLKLDESCFAEKNSPSHWVRPARETVELLNWQRLAHASY